MVETLSQLFLFAIKSYPKDALILYKEEGKYVPISTKEFGDKIKHISLGLRDLDFVAGDKLIILSETCPNWVMTDLAGLCLGGIIVPIYTTLAPEQIKYIIDNSDAKIVVCSTQELWQKVDAVKNELHKVEHFITFQPEAPEGVLTLAGVIEKGKKVDQENPELFEKLALEVKPDDLASIIYTSGTTGVPKGVMLLHSNIVSNVKTVTSILPISDKDTGLSSLPLSHIFERVVTMAYLFKGCTIAYTESFPDTLMENLLEIRPNIAALVPRVFEKIYAKIMDNVLSSSPLKRKIFFWALKVGKKYGRRKILLQPIPKLLQFKRNLANKLVFSKIVAKTGGGIKFFVTGAAPLSKSLGEFFYAMGMVVLEGYGLSETSPCISINTFESLKFGSVGKPIPGVEVKIAEDGEILTRGPNVMKGYYKMEAETDEVFEREWFCTGDVGHLDEDGFLVITDRKKDLIVTAGGKNVAPQPIENLIRLNSYVANAVCIGDRRKFISALIVPDFDKLEEYAKSNNIPYENLSDLIEREEIKNFILSEIDGSTPDLASYEKVKNIGLLDRDFEIEKGELTPTLKVKRNIVEEKYKDLIDSLYVD